MSTHTALTAGWAAGAAGRRGPTAPSWTRCQASHRHRRCDRQTQALLPVDPAGGGAGRRGEPDELAGEGTGDYHDTPVPGAVITVVDPSLSKVIARYGRVDLL